MEVFIGTGRLADILKRGIFGNTVWDYAVALVTFLVIVYGLILFKDVVVARLKRLAEKSATTFDDFLVGLIGQIGAPVYVTVALYLSTRSLALNPTLHKVILILLVAAVTYRGVRMLQMAVSYGLEKIYLKGREADPGSVATVKTMSAITNWVIFAGGVVFLLDNMGVNVSAVVAGLGIGGIAVALAAQAVLGDLFASFSIFLDKPFQPGDFIIVGDLMGTVEQIGIKTTRVRSLSGEQLVFSNADLTSSRIRNFKQMFERRALFQFGVVYQTPLDKVKRIPDMVREIIGGIGETRLDRANFFKFGDSSLDFEVVYYVKKPDYNIYMNCQERINLALMERFQKEGIEFAYPTRTLYIEKQ
ncbi:mechanosensitive ion channel family protein [bacterium]|nr:mechanosensitive ion channel family protein [bacterium]